MLDGLLKQGVEPQELREALSRFKLTRKLGAGAFGQVFYGLDVAVNRDCAIKVASSSLRR